MANSHRPLDRLQYVHAKLTFEPKIIPSIIYLRFIPYTKFEDFQFFVFELMRTNRETPVIALLTQLPLAGVIIVITH